jgi:hypothetical protein
MHIITIDPSINCTAMVIDDKKIIITHESYACNKSGFNKWFNICQPFINYHIINDMKPENDYSKLEIQKLRRFKEISLLIFNIISKECRGDISIYIEGYSYSSNAGPLIDLVTLSTCIRLKCLSLTDNITIVSPKTLKSLTAKWVYNPIKIKNKIEYRNNDGVIGGKFTKFEMCKAIIESNISCPWSNFLRDNSDIILKNKNIPKPIEDINDAKIMFEIFKDK